MTTYDQSISLQEYLPSDTADLEIGRGLVYARRGTFQRPFCVAWSLGRLVELMPEIIDESKALKFEKWFDPEQGAECYSFYYEDADGRCFGEVYDTNPVESACKMIEWLNDNEKLSL